MAARISTYGQSLANLRNLVALQKEMNERSIQAMEMGQISEYFSGLGANTEPLIDMSVQISTISVYQNNLTLVDNRLSSSDTITKLLINHLIKIQNDIIQGLGVDEVSSQACIDQARLGLDEVERIANSFFNNIYLFGQGSAIPPVDTSVLPTPNIGDAPDYSYSRVGSSPMRVKVEDNKDYFEFGIAADEPAFEAAIRGLMLVKTADPSDQDRLKEGLAKINAAINLFAGLQSKIGQQQSQINTLRAFHDLAKEELLGSYQSLSSIDPASAVQRFQDSKNQLDLTYQILRIIKSQSLLAE